METSPEVSPRELLAPLNEEIDQFVESVVEMVNNAADGERIAGSEETARDLAAELHQKIFERAVQLKVNAAEAAFPPPPGPTSGSDWSTRHRGIADCWSRWRCTSPSWMHWAGFYHLSENVHRVRRVVFDEELPERQAWAGKLMHTFRHEGYTAARQRLVQ